VQDQDGQNFNSNCHAYNVDWFNLFAFTFGLLNS